MLVPSSFKKHVTLHRQWFSTVGNEVEVDLAAEFGARGPITLVFTHGNVGGTRQEKLRRLANGPSDLQEFLGEVESLDFQLNYDWRELAKAGNSLPKRFQPVFTYYDRIGEYPLSVNEYNWDTGRDCVHFGGDLSLKPSPHWVGDVREYSWSWACTVSTEDDSDSAHASGDTYEAFLANLVTGIYQATVHPSTVDDAISDHKVLGRHLRELKRAAGRSLLPRK